MNGLIASVAAGACLLALSAGVAFADNRPSVGAAIWALPMARDRLVECLLKLPNVHRKI